MIPENRLLLDKFSNGVFPMDGMTTVNSIRISGRILTYKPENSPHSTFQVKAQEEGGVRLGDRRGEQMSHMASWRIVLR